MDRPRRQLPSLHARWRSVASSDKARTRLGGSLSAPPGASRSSTSGASMSGLPPRPRSAAFRRVKKAFFDRPDARTDEDLRSTKRRIIQIWRQSETSPVQCALGFRSRTGWEPIRAVRENQDCVVGLMPWGPRGQYALFAALDGHGRSGHLCSMFVAQRVISYLGRSLTARTVDVAYALHRAIEYAERRLTSGQVNIDCEVSGSTGVFVLLDRSTLYCANVGDSRAVLGRKLPMLSSKYPPSMFQTSMLSNNDSARSMPRDTNDDIAPVEVPPPTREETNEGDISAPCGYVPVPLSFDHKPAREDEKKRVIAAGGRVDAWQGVDVGAERVWLPHSRTPGLAVTRSFGDSIVKEIGVTATPEIYSLPLSDSDSFIVIASDGVWEFVTNYEVVSIVSKHRDAGTPQRAAEEIVKLSADRWMDDDSVIDDISCVVVFLEVKDPASVIPCEPALVTINHHSATMMGTPMSSQGGYIHSSSSNNAMFGQFSASSSDIASQGTSRRILSRNGFHLRKPRSNVSLRHVDSQTSASEVNDIVRQYAQRMEQDYSRGDLARHSSPRANIQPPPLSLNSGGSARELFGKSRSNVSFTSLNNDLACLAPGAGNEPESLLGTDPTGDPSAFNDADVSEDSERFEDAEEDIVSPQIPVPSPQIPVSKSTSPPKHKIMLSDDEDAEKFADADSLVPIDLRNVVRTQKVSLHRRRPPPTPPTPPPLTPPRANSAVTNRPVTSPSNRDRPEPAVIGNLEDGGPPPPQQHAPSSSFDGFFGARIGKGLRPLKGLRIGSDFGVRRTNDSNSGSGATTSGRLRRRMPGRRPQSANVDG